MVGVEAGPMLGNASVRGVYSKQIGTGLKFHKVMSSKISAIPSSRAQTVAAPTLSKGAGLLLS
jgi:hypothetical protein